MYHTCIACRRGLGRNRLIAHLSIGRQLAFDPARGRLWVICPSCRQWNLTPIEERWEAVEECEAAFNHAGAHAVAQGIGLARSPEGTELVRIGAAASRNDIINWRYGRRLHHRRGRILLTAALLGGLALGTLALIGISSGSVLLTAWVGALLLGWATSLPESISWRVVAHAQERDGTRVWVRQSDLRQMTLAHRADHLSLTWPSSRTEDVHVEGAALENLLASLLPRVNWLGGSPDVVRDAVHIVDQLEGQSAEPPGTNPPIWEHVVRLNPKRLALMAMPAARRLALEMSVTEHIELAQLAGEAASLRLAHRAAERIAAIADTLGLPPFITDWLERHHRKGGHTEAPAA